MPKPTYEMPDRCGFFRVKPIASMVRKSKNKGAIGIEVNFRILEWWNTEEQTWEDWREYNPYEVVGCYWIISGEGNPNLVATEFLGRGLKWKGDVRDFANPSKDWPDCVCSVKERVFERGGQETMVREANMLQDYDWTPTAQELDDSVINEVMNAHGSALRAILSKIEAPPAPAIPPWTAPQDLPKGGVPF